jgi:hypothetical protein
MGTGKMKPVFSVAANVNIFAIKHKYRKTCGVISQSFPETRLPKTHVVPLGILFLFFLCCRMVEATEVIMIVSNGRIIIAADSLVLGGDAPVFSCKIDQSGGIYWAAAGFTAESPRYDSRKILIKAARKQYSVREMLDLAGLELLPALQKE